VIYAYHYKWLCAPKGAGFLYARHEVQDLLEPLVVSWGWQSEKPGPSKFVDYHEWWGTRDIAAFLSVPAAIKFQEENVWEKVRSDCHTLVDQAEERIRGLTRLPSQYVDDSWYAQMAAVPIPSETDSVALKTRLYDDYRVEVPLVEWNGRKLIRVSVQAYNTQADIDYLLKSLEKCLGG
jgi:isopenicillin-N epimerase